MRALSEALAALDRLLAEDGVGQERAWVARLDQTLAQVRRAARRDDAALESPEEGLLDEAAAARSATLGRQVGALHQELGSLAGEAAALRAEARQLLEAATAGEPSALEALRRRAQTLRGGLRHYESSEAGVLLEAVTTDIGAGD